MGLRGRELSGWVAVVVAVCAIAGCGGGGSEPREDSPTISTASETPTSTTRAQTAVAIDPRARPAVEAYLKFVHAARLAARRPPAVGATYPPGGDFTKYSFDPIRAKYAEYVIGLSKDGAAMRGVPPLPRVSVKSIQLSAPGYPTVVLSDCPTPASTWKEYVIATGKEVRSSPARVAPPYRLSVEVIRYSGRWGVSKIIVDMSRTCIA
jgi:hypothetical protein